MYRTTASTLGTCLGDGARCLDRSCRALLCLIRASVQLLIVLAFLIGPVACKNLGKDPPLDKSKLELLPSRGYQPVNPIPDPEPFRGTLLEASSSPERRALPVLSQLQNEAVRLAIGKKSSDGDTRFGPVGVTEANETYIVVLDYIKYIPKTVLVSLKPATQGSLAREYEVISKSRPKNPSPVSDVAESRDIVAVPVYAGIGLRLLATVTTKQRGVDISSLESVGLAASQGELTGSLQIQTLGITGRGISGLLPIPTEINR